MADNTDVIIGAPSTHSNNQQNKGGEQEKTTN
jgi:hypothetical protein